jgi:restriction system protein
MGKAKGRSRGKGKGKGRARKSWYHSRSLLLAAVVLLGVLLALTAGWWLLLLVPATVATALWTYRRRAAFRTRRHTSLTRVDGMSGTAFEHFVADLLRRDGCLNVRVIGAANDRGVDIVAHDPSGKKIAVQCKRHGPNTVVDATAVYVLNGNAGPEYGADRAVVVTTNRLTKPAREYAYRHGIETVERDHLIRWIAGRPPLADLRRHASADTAAETPGEGSPAERAAPVPAGQGGKPFLWATVAAAAPVVALAGFTSTVVVAAAGVTLAAVANGTDAYLNLEPPARLRPWLPTWAEACARTGMAAAMLWFILVIDIWIRA